MEVPAKPLRSTPGCSVRAQTPRDVTVPSDDSRAAPANQRHWRHESVSQDGKADAVQRVWIFEAYSDVQSIRPKKRSSCRDEPAGARYAIGASETGRSLLEANRPLAGCFPAEPASVSSGNVISTQDSHKRNHWTTAANATIGHRSMPQKIPRCVGVNRPFGSGGHGHQPESSLSRMAHLAPEYWPTFWPELTQTNVPDPFR